MDDLSLKAANKTWNVVLWTHIFYTLYGGTGREDVWNNRNKLTGYEGTCSLKGSRTLISQTTSIE